MAVKNIYGLASIAFAAIATDGGAGSSFSDIGQTVKDSCQLTSSDPQTTDFNIEESDSPIQSIVSTAAEIALATATYNVSADQLEALFGGTAKTGSIATLGTITGGSSYTNGSYTAVALTGGTGTGATANITVAGGAVTVVTIVNGGSGYAAAASLSALAANIGGTGTGFAVVVSTVQTIWEAPDSLPEIEKTFKITDKKGNVLLIPRGKLIPKLTMPFAGSKLGQLDINIKVLQPTKTGEKRMTIKYA